MIYNDEYYVLNIENNIKMNLKGPREFTFEFYYKQIGFTNDSYYLLKNEKKCLVLFATNLTKKIPDPTKAKEQYELFLRNKDKQI